MNLRCPMCGTEMTERDKCPKCGLHLETMKPRAQVGWFEKRTRALKALNRKDRLIYLGVSALIVITVSFWLTSMFTPPTIPNFELQVKNCLYNPSTGSFSVSGTFGIQVPREYYYSLVFVSITDGNKTITRFSDLGSTSVTFHVSQWRPDMGTDWTFLIGEGVTLESKNVQLTIGYAISYGRGQYASPDVLETGTEVFLVNVEDA